MEDDGASNRGIQTIGAFVVNAECSWDQLEENTFKNSTLLTQYLVRTIKWSNTREALANAKIYYCWTTPLDYSSVYDGSPINLVFICGDSLSTCTEIHRILKREKKQNGNELTARLPLKIDIDCAIFWIESQHTNQVSDSIKWHLESHFNPNYSPKINTAFIGIVNTDRSRTNQSQSSKNDVNISSSCTSLTRHICDLKTMYLTLCQLIPAILKFRLKTKLASYSNSNPTEDNSNSVSPSPNSAITTSPTHDSSPVHEYETLNLPNNESEVYEDDNEDNTPTGFSKHVNNKNTTTTTTTNNYSNNNNKNKSRHKNKKNNNNNRFQLDKLEDVSRNPREKLLSLSLSSHSAQTYFGDKSPNSKTSQGDVFEPTKLSSNDSILPKNGLDDPTERDYFQKFADTNVDHKQSHSRRRSSRLGFLNKGSSPHINMTDRSSDKTSRHESTSSYENPHDMKSQSLPKSPRVLWQLHLNHNKRQNSFEENKSKSLFKIFTSVDNNGPEKLQSGRKFHRKSSEEAIEMNSTPHIASRPDTSSDEITFSQSMNLHPEKSVPISQQMNKPTQFRSSPDVHTQLKALTDFEKQHLRPWRPNQSGPASLHHNTSLTTIQEPISPIVPNRLMSSHNDMPTLTSEHSQSNKRQFSITSSSSRDVRAVAHEQSKNAQSNHKSDDKHIPRMFDRNPHSAHRPTADVDNNIANTTYSAGESQDGLHFKFSNSFHQKMKHMYPRTASTPISTLPTQPWKFNRIDFEDHIPPRPHQEPDSSSPLYSKESDVEAEVYGSPADVEPYTDLNSAETSPQDDWSNDDHLLPNPACDNQHKAPNDVKRSSINLQLEECLFDSKSKRDPLKLIKNNLTNNSKRPSIAPDIKFTPVFDDPTQIDRLEPEIDWGDTVPTSRKCSLSVKYDRPRSNSPSGRSRSSSSASRSDAESHTNIGRERGRSKSIYAAASKAENGLDPSNASRTASPVVGGRTYTYTRGDPQTQMHKKSHASKSPKAKARSQNERKKKSKQD